MVISHHGEYEYGSPKLPMTLEAVALHHLDNLDAKMASFTQLIKDCPNVESNWTQYHANLGRKLYKGASSRRNQSRFKRWLTVASPPTYSTSGLPPCPTSATNFSQHVNQPNYQPVKPAVIAKKLGLTGDAAEEVKQDHQAAGERRQSPTARAIWCSPSARVRPRKRPRRRRPTRQRPKRVQPQSAALKSTAIDDLPPTKESNRERTDQKTESRA